MMKTLFFLTEATINELSDQLCVAPYIVDGAFQRLRKEQLVQAVGLGASGGHRLQLTGGGRTRAAELLSVDQYVGPVPVSLKDYVERVRSQTIRDMPVHPADVRGHGLRVGQAAVAQPAYDDVPHRGQHRRRGAHPEQHPAVAADPRGHRVEHPLGEVGREQAAHAHRQARHRVGQLIVAGPGAGLDGVGALPEVLRTHRPEERRDRQHRQIDLHGAHDARSAGARRRGPRFASGPELTAW